MSGLDVFFWGITWFVCMSLHPFIVFRFVSFVFCDLACFEVYFQRHQRAVYTICILSKSITSSCFNTVLVVNILFLVFIY